MSLTNEVVAKAKYESGVEFRLIRIPMSDGGSCWDIEVVTSMSYVRFAMETETAARKFFEYLTDSDEIVEVSTDDELPDPKQFQEE